MRERETRVRESFNNSNTVVREQEREWTTRAKAVDNINTVVKVKERDNDDNDERKKEKNRTPLLLLQPLYVGSFVVSPYR